MKLKVYIRKQARIGEWKNYIRNRKQQNIKWKEVKGGKEYYKQKCITGSYVEGKPYKYTQKNKKSKEKQEEIKGKEGEEGKAEEELRGKAAVPLPFSRRGRVIGRAKFLS